MLLICVRASAAVGAAAAAAAARTAAYTCLSTFRTLLKLTLTQPWVTTHPFPQQKIY